MTLYLVRHAQAGHKHSFGGPDDERPLSPVGQAEAMGIADALGRLPIRRVLSSPFRRCIETLEPLAERLHVPVEVDDALDERAGDDDVIALVAEIGDQAAALCTHGNIVPVVLDHLRRNGTTFGRGPHDWKKGSVWILRTNGSGAFTEASYLPPSRSLSR